MLIAAQAVALDVVLITNKVREFGRIEGLRIQNWAADRAK
jgi:tRNA(fMet)-specific endonuclease VapC